MSMRILIRGYSYRDNRYPTSLPPSYALVGGLRRSPLTLTTGARPVGVNVAFWLIEVWLL